MSIELKILDINKQAILRLPKNISQTLPSKGQVMIEGTINGLEFKEPLEPDGNGSHFLKLTDKLLANLKIKTADTIKLEFAPTKDWPDPIIPSDLKTALQSNHIAQTTWAKITPMAKWDWIRWIRGTKSDKTHKRRIEVAISKLKSGMRRPCCFNRTECTYPNLSNNGVLLETS